MSFTYQLIGFLFPLLFINLQQGDNDVKFIEIRKIPFQRMYPINISCDDFDMRAASIFADTFMITKPEMQQRIVNAVAHAKKAYQYDLDIRAKVFVEYNSGKIDTICLTEFEYFTLNGTVMLFPNADVVNMVDSLPIVNFNKHGLH